MGCQLFTVPACMTQRFYFTSGNDRTIPQFQDGKPVPGKFKVIGDKQTTTNLRYKHGRNLNYEPKEVLAFRDPREAGLPTPTVNSSFIFAREDGYLCYPNNYNYYANYYRNTFQHGGVSLEEMIVPVIKMQSK